MVCAGGDNFRSARRRSWAGRRNWEVRTAEAGTQKKGRGSGGSLAPFVCGGGRVFRRCPTLPRPVGRSTIGAGGLSFRVRDGSGRFPSAVTTGTPHHPHQGFPCGGWGVWSLGYAQWTRTSVVRYAVACRDLLGCVWASPRPISTSPLNALRRLHVWPINPLVWWGP